MKLKVEGFGSDIESSPFFIFYARITQLIKENNFKVNSFNPYNRVGQFALI